LADPDESEDLRLVLEPAVGNVLLTGKPPRFPNLPAAATDTVDVEIKDPRDMGGGMEAPVVPAIVPAFSFFFFAGGDKEVSFPFFRFVLLVVVVLVVVLAPAAAAAAAAAAKVALVDRRVFLGATSSTK
jgi:hypothetical protein